MTHRKIHIENIVWGSLILVICIIGGLRIECMFDGSFRCERLAAASDDLTDDSTVLAPTIYTKWHFDFCAMYKLQITDYKLQIRMYEFTNYLILGRKYVAWNKNKQIFAMWFILYILFLACSFCLLLQFMATKNLDDFWARGHKTLPRSMWKLIRMNQRQLLPLPPPPAPPPAPPPPPLPVAGDKTFALSSFYKNLQKFSLSFFLGFVCVFFSFCFVFGWGLGIVVYKLSVIMYNQKNK